MTARGKPEAFVVSYIPLLTSKWDWGVEPFKNVTCASQ
jgi:hypothetical protein